MEAAMVDAFFRVSLPVVAAALWFGSCAPSTGIHDISSRPVSGSQPDFRRFPAVTVRALNLSPSSVTGGQPAHGTVVLTAAAPAPGIVVELSADDRAVNVPATVKVAGGATSAAFTVTTLPVSATTTAMITGKHDGVSKTVGLAVKSSLLTSISLNPTTVPSGSTSTATVQLDGNAPPGGIAVTLSSNKPSRAGVPPSVLVAAGSDSATFAVNTTAGEAVAATISASTDSVTKTAALTIQQKKPQLSTTALKRAASNAQNKPRVPQTY
jgi:hypothetical protein